MTQGHTGPTVQGDAGHVDEVQEVKGHQVNAFEEAHGWEGWPPVPAEGALLLQSHMHTDTHRMKRCTARRAGGPLGHTGRVSIQGLHGSKRAFEGQLRDSTA